MKSEIFSALRMSRKTGRAFKNGNKKIKRRFMNSHKNKK